MLVSLQTLIMISGLLEETFAGYRHFELGLYLQLLFGFELPGYLLIAVLALAIHVLVNQKYVAHLALALICAMTAFAPSLGFERRRCSTARTSAGSIRTCAASIRLWPFLWFKAYWAGWALLLAVVAKLLWIRGVEPRRIQFTRAGWTLAAAIGVIVTTGSLVSSISRTTTYRNVASNTNDTIDAMHRWRSHS